MARWRITITQRDGTFRVQEVEAGNATMALMQRKMYAGEYEYRIERVSDAKEER